VPNFLKEIIFTNFAVTGFINPVMTGFSIFAKGFGLNPSVLDFSIFETEKYAFFEIWQCFSF